MKKNFINFALLGLVLSGVLLGCSNKTEAPTSKNDNTENAESITLNIGHVEPENRSTHQALLEFKKNVEERTSNSILIEIHPNGALGGDVQLTESVAMGTLDMALPSTSVLTKYSDDFGVLDMPYLFTAPENAFKAMDGEIGEYFNAKLEEKGIHNLGYSYNGPRSTTTNVKAIEKPEDLKGIKMRVMESPIFIDFYKTLGANPTPMSFTELYTGLQQGTVDAQENPPSLILANKFYEVQKYLSVDEHVHNFLAFIMNKNKFDSLTEEQQKILTEEAKSYVEKQRALELEDNKKAIEKLATEGGLQVNELSEEQKQAFKDALKPMYEEYSQKFSKELFEKSDKYNK
ncbi:MAG: TRAP transporter substrate-binding protein [Peptoanaerobacter stomatis]|uniref:TRAP transporter substrate-binding protein n=1 Tax=Peptoanaerobacter stomatis TaxID=796937 RepID=UPI003F9FDD5D